MKKVYTTVSLIAAALLLAQGAHAQTAASAPMKTRAEVKAEAKDAVKKGTDAKGEGSGAVEQAKSVKSRAEVKAETKEAIKAGKGAPKGESNANLPVPKSEKTRAEVKVEAKEAVKKGTDAKGEGSGK
jgi:predicted RNase H-like HicB family nuclease